MKTGKSLVEMAQTLQHMKDHARDFTVPAAKLVAKTVFTDHEEGHTSKDVVIAFQNGKDHAFTPSQYANSQVAGYTGVPRQYYDKLAAENPDLLAENINHGFEVIAKRERRDKKPESRLIRTVDGKMRALLSSSYRRLDSFDLANQLLPVLADQGMEVVASELTDTRFYLKALTPKLKADIKVGDTVQYGIMISNSDVGAGSVRIEPMTMRLICLNGMISNTAMRTRHLTNNQAENDIRELLSERTMNMTDAAFWATVKDVTLASLRPEIFEQEVNRYRDAAKQEIKNYDVPEVIELSMKATGTTGEGTKQNMIAYLANGADGAGLTRWGLANAFTHAAQKVENFDQSIELERAGAQIITMSENAWKHVANK
jgi:Domain of unknown function (DUF932)